MCLAGAPPQRAAIQPRRAPRHENDGPMRHGVLDFVRSRSYTGRPYSAMTLANSLQSR